MKILIIKFGALGDMVQAAPAFSAIRKSFPNSDLALLTTRPYRGLAERMRYFDEIHVDERAKLYNISSFLSIKRLLRGVSCVYDLQGVDRTFLYSLFSPRSTQWIGLSFAERSLHPYERFSRQLSGFPLDLNLDLTFLAEPLDSSWKTKLNPPYVLVIPGSSSAHQGLKRWTWEGYASLLNSLLQKGIQPVLIGQEDFSFLAEKAPGTLNLSGKTTIFQIISLAQQANFSIGNDTGPQLLASGGGCPTLTFFSERNPPSIGGARGKQHYQLYQPVLKDLTLSRVMDKLYSTSLLS